MSETKHETKTEVKDTAAAEAAAEAAKAAKAAEKAAKAEQKKADADKKKAEREVKKAEQAAAREQKKADELAKKEQAKADAAAAKEAARMPEQNGVRRPKPDTLCGKAWLIFDQISQKNGAAASIGESLKVAEEQGLNVGNVRAEYARWRKFFGVSGRISDPTAAAQAPQTSEHPAQ